MPPISTIFKQIINDFPGISFKTADSFYWSSSKNTVYHPKVLKIEDVWCLLHEVAHSQLDHSRYALDIDLIKQETSAWELANNSLAKIYEITIDEGFMQNYLDTYRNWLHARSQCPDCKQNGIQTQNTYRCINCRCSWRANEARLCGLKRVRQPE